MTIEVEKHFFNIFGIDPIGCNDNQNCTGTLDCIECSNVKYPEITDRILLELICILSEWRQYCDSDYVIKAINIDNLKEDILKDCLHMSNWYEFKKCGKDIKHQVRTLFEEG